MVNLDVPEQILSSSADDDLVVLKPAGREARLISEVNDLAVEGCGYVDADAAAEAGRNWRRWLAVALAREHRGVDFGADDRLTPVVDMVYGDEPPEIAQQVGIKVGDRIVDDDDRLLVYATEPIPKVVYFQLGTLTVTQSGWLQRFEQRIKDARRQEPASWNRQKAMAYRLLNLALIDANPETRHIQLVTAIEVLLEQQDHPKNILGALNTLLAEVAKWPDSTTKDRIKQILNQSKKEESINRSGQEQIAKKIDDTYSEKSPGDFFKYVYDVRTSMSMT